MCNLSPRWIPLLLTLFLYLSVDSFAYQFGTTQGFFHYLSALTYPLSGPCAACAPDKPGSKSIAQTATKKPPPASTIHLKPRARFYAAKHQLAPDWFLALIETESNWEPKSFNKNACHGRGLGQLTVPAVKDCHTLGRQKIVPTDSAGHFDVELNLDCTAWTLARHYRHFKDYYKATLAYQSGAGNVRKGKVSQRAQNYAQLVLLRFRQAGAAKL